MHSKQLNVSWSLNTEEGGLLQDDQYFGYSLASGHFTAEKSRVNAVVGQPKAINYRGQVNL